MNTRRSSIAILTCCLALAFALSSSSRPVPVVEASPPPPSFINDDRRNRPRRRLTVLADESIASAVQIAHEGYDDVEYPTSFVLNAEVVDVAGDSVAASGGGGGEYELVVREALPAISSATTLSVDGVPAGNVDSDVVSTMLVSDVDGILALISVDVHGSGNVRGIIRDDNGGDGEGTGMKFAQDGEGGTVSRRTESFFSGGIFVECVGECTNAYFRLTKRSPPTPPLPRHILYNARRNKYIEFKATVGTAREFTPPAWSCGFGGGERDRDDDRDVNATMEYPGGDYHLLHDHDDGHDHHHDDIVGSLFDLHRSLRGSTTRLGKPRRVLGEAYAYWVDVYVEIDYTLCNDNGETCANGIGINTINYGTFMWF